MSSTIRKQNLTVALSPETVGKAKMLAARRSTSISGLVTEQIEFLVRSDEEFERSKREALALLKTGFHLGGKIISSRDDWHER
jgi:hypothetical protein